MAGAAAGWCWWRARRLVQGMGFAGMMVAGTPGRAGCSSRPTPLPPCPPQVKGFNVRRWMKENKKKLPAVLESLGKLMSAGKLRAEFTE